MPRCIDEIECVVFLIAGLVFDLDGVQFDGDAAFLLEVHIIEHLFRHIAGGDGAGILQETVGKR